MKKYLISGLAVLCCIVVLAGCGKSIMNENPVSRDFKQTTGEEITEAVQERTETTEQTGERQIKMLVDNQEIRITLYDTPAANALYDMLPLNLTFEDFNNTEKISYLNDALPTEDEPDGCQPEIGDLCFYAPWGNLSVFYSDFRYSDSLIKLGHIEGDLSVIAQQQNDFNAVLEKEV